MTKPSTHTTATLNCLPDDTLDLIFKSLCAQSSKSNTSLYAPAGLLALGSTCRRLRHKSIPYLAIYFPFRTSIDWCGANAKYLTWFQHPIPNVTLPISNQITYKSTRNPSHHVIGTTPKSINGLDILLHLLEQHPTPPLRSIDIDLQQGQALHFHLQHLLPRVASTLKRFTLRCSGASVVPRSICFDNFSLEKLVLSFTLGSGNGWSSIVHALKALPVTCLQLFISGSLVGKLPKTIIRPLVKNIQRLELINNYNPSKSSEDELNLQLNKEGNLKDFIGLVPLCTCLQELCIDGFNLTDQDIRHIKNDTFHTVQNVQLKRMDSENLYRVLQSGVERVVTVIEMTKELMDPKLISILPTNLRGLALKVDEKSIVALRNRMEELSSLESLRVDIFQVYGSIRGHQVALKTLNAISNKLKELRITGCCYVDWTLTQLITSQGPNLKVLALKMQPFMKECDRNYLTHLGQKYLHRHQQLSRLHIRDHWLISVTRYEEIDNTAICWIDKSGNELLSGPTANIGSSV